MAGDVRDPRLFDYDEFSGVTELFIYDPDTEGFTIQTQQDVEPLIERNKALWNEKEKHSRYGELAHIASIPPVILMDLAQKGILTVGGKILDDKRYRAFLNDSDNRCFRTRPGRV